MQRLIFIPASLIAATSAFAQTASQTAAPPPAEIAGEPISLLMFATLGGALAIAIFALVWFARKRTNRAALDRTLNPNHPANN